MMSVEGELANKILRSLIERNGFDDAWDACDDLIKMEIKDEITEIIRIDIDRLAHDVWMDS